jgi:ribosome biogenesis GTPase
LTQDIREDDARGRHTTTGRSLHRMNTGGWLIDTPGMRGLGVAEVAYGIDATFPEISERAMKCKFRDCEHESEPGCKVQQAIAAGDIDPDRLDRFRKLKRENEHATQTIAQSRERGRKQGKIYRAAVQKKGR